MVFGYLTINNETIEESTDLQTKKQLLEKAGAIISEDPAEALTITGPFTISRQEFLNKSVFLNDGNFNTGLPLILGSFKNSATGCVKLTSGSLEDLFTSPSFREYDAFQQGARLFAHKPRP